MPGKFHGWRSLVGYSPWGRKESAERLHFLSSTNDSKTLPNGIHINHHEGPLNLPGSPRGRMSGKAAVKMCRAQWKSREPRGRACRGAARQRRNTHSTRVLADHKSQGLGCRGSGGCRRRPAREAGAAEESHGPSPARTSPRGGRLASWPPSGSPGRPSGCRATGGVGSEAGGGSGKEGL